MPRCNEEPTPDEPKLLTHAEARAGGPRLDAGDLTELDELLATAAPALAMRPPR